MFPLTAVSWVQALHCGGEWQNDRKSLMTLTTSKGGAALFKSSHAEHLTRYYWEKLISF